MYNSFDFRSAAKNWYLEKDVGAYARLFPGIYGRPVRRINDTEILRGEGARTKMAESYLPDRQR